MGLSLIGVVTKGVWGGEFLDEEEAVEGREEEEEEELCRLCEDRE